MEQLGADFSATGSVMDRSQLEELRRKRGECISCGRKCFKKKLFKMIPITEPGRVLEGRCLNCNPLSANDTAHNDTVLPAVSRPATQDDLARFTRSQSNLGVNGPLATTPGSVNGRKKVTRRSSSAAAMDAPAPPASVRDSTRSLNVIAGRHTASPATSVRRVVSPPSESAPPLRQHSDKSITAPSYHRQPSVDSMHGHSHASNSVGASTGPVHMGPSSSRRLASPPPSNGSVNAEPSAKLPPPDRGLNRVVDGSRRSVASASARSMGQSSFRSESSHPSPGRAHGVVGNGYNDDGHSKPPPVASIPNHHNELQRGSGHGDDRAPPTGTTVSTEHHSGSSRSLRSASTLGDGSDAGTPNDNYDGSVSSPTHGILNRGGEFAFQIPINGTGGRQISHLVTGSSRTLSSMSSIEEDPACYIEGRPGSSNRLGSTIDVALYEEEEQQQQINDGDGSTRSGWSNHSRLAEIERLRQAGSDHEEIFAILKENMDSAAVLKDAMERLANIPFEEVGRPLPPEHCNILVEAMRRHAPTKKVQLWGCGAIWNMTSDRPAQIAFVQAGALDVVLAAMDRFLNETKLQETAIATISNLSVAAENLSVLMERGVVRRIVQAMNTHSDIGSTQLKGCIAVTNLASHDSPLKQQIMELGGGGAVVISMVMHAEDSYLQEKALRALRNLCANNDHNKTELANIGGIDAVISAMQIHRDEAGVQLEGAWTLSNLAGNEPNKVVIGDCGGIDVVIRAMWVHSDNVAVQEWCCRALYTLTWETLHNAAVVLDVGGISALVNAMQAHVDSAPVQEMGCAVLGNLATSPASKMRIVDEEALDAIVLAMVLHSSNMQVQVRACWVLLELAIPENVVSMQAANVAELVQTAARTYGHECEEPAHRLQRVLDECK